MKMHKAIGEARASVRSIVTLFGIRRGAADVYRAGVRSSG